MAEKAKKEEEVKEEATEEKPAKEEKAAKPKAKAKAATKKKEASLDDIIEQIAGLSVLELSELVKALEEKFGVEAAAPMMMGAMPAAGGGAEAAADEAPTAFDVILKEIGSQKIQVIKEVRAITGLGLKEAKALVDEAPKAIKEDVNEDEANQIREKVEAVGAVVEIKGK